MKSVERLRPLRRPEPEQAVEISIPLDDVRLNVPAERSGARRAQGSGQPLLALAQGFPGPDELFLGALAGEQDAVRVLQRDRPQQPFLVVECGHV